MKKLIGETFAVINLDHIRQNLRNIRRLIQPNTKVCAVIKANAYGHGSVRLAKLYEEEGVDYFAVATASEALELRHYGIHTPILCLGFVPDEQFENIVQNDIDIAIYSLEKAKRLSQEAVAQGKTAKIHIKLDTGMSRIGYPCNEETVKEIRSIASLEGIRCRGLFTHFARADEEDPSCTHQQFTQYDRMARRLEEEGVTIEIRHVCNSAGIMMFPEYHLDMVRPGIILYGHYPSDEVDTSKIELHPAMSLRTTVSHVKKMEAGIGISYGHKYVTSSEETVATLPIGYAHGFTRMLSGSADVKIGNQIFPVVGRICMDQCMALVTGADVKVGDPVTIFSDEKGLEIERLAKKIGTVNYELLCMIQRRIPRVYEEKGKETEVIDYLS